jgi:hypothetical protein
MKSKLLYFVLSCSLLLGACSSEEKNEKEAAAPVSVYKDVQLKLDDGNKWKVSEQMVPSLKASFTLIDETANSDNPNYAETANELLQLKNEFVGACDMTGEGHNILHEWLIPYMDLLMELEKVEDQKKAKQLFADVVVARNMYPKYFE